MTVLLMLVAYGCLAAILPAAGRPWLALPLTLTALAAIGSLWLRALPGVALSTRSEPSRPATLGTGPVQPSAPGFDPSRPPGFDPGRPPGLGAGPGWLSASGARLEAGWPAARMAFALVAGLVTLPLVALALHAAGEPVRPAPLVVGGAVAATLLGAVALLRERLSATRPGRKAGPVGLPAQRTPGGAAPDTGGPQPSSTAASPAPAAAPAPLPAPASVASASEAFPAPSFVAPASVAPGSGTSADHVVGPAASGGSRLARIAAGCQTAAAVTVPAALALTVGGFAVRAYVSAPHPAQPGYLSVALNGWAAQIDRPVTVPASGLSVPVRVTSSGLDTLDTVLRLRVGGRLVSTRPVTVAAETARSMTVRVPALPPDGCLRAVHISVGKMSTGFFAQAPRAATRPAAATRAAAVTSAAATSRAGAASRGSAEIRGSAGTSAGARIGGSATTSVAAGAGAHAAAGMAAVRPGPRGRAAC